MSTPITGALGGPARTFPSTSGATPGVVASNCLIASGGHLAIPRLDGVPTKYQMAFGIQPAAKLGRTLLEAGLADCNDWRQSGKKPVEFVEKTLHRWAAAHGADEIAREFALALALASDLDPYGNECSGPKAVEEMYLVLEPESAGYVVLGPTLRMLEKLHPRLPVTFFNLFTGALGGWVRVYDYRDALERVEMLREWCDGDPEAEQVELPDVEGAIPNCLRKRKPLTRRFVEQLAARTRDRRLRAILGEALELSLAAERAERPKISVEALEPLMDSNPPLPALLAVFEKHDAIEGCFDDEAQGMMECQPEPNVIIPLRIADLESVKQAFRIAEVVCDVLVRAARLIKLVMGDVEQRGRAECVQS